MRAWTIGLACSLLFGMMGVAPARADEAEPAAAEESASADEAAPAEESEASEEAEPGVIAGYGKQVANTFLAGLNGVITWPADPVMLAIEPVDAMRDLPGAVVTAPVVGFFAGTLQGVLRLFTGTLDVALCPLTFFPMFSIEPRYQLIPGWEHGG